MSSWLRNNTMLRYMAIVKDLGFTIVLIVIINTLTEHKMMSVKAEIVAGVAMIGAFIFSFFYHVIQSAIERVNYEELSALQIEREEIQTPIDLTIL